jgi:transcriptional regulator with XRE-family HTH domain
MLELSNDVRSTFSELLLKSRRIAGLTQEELADRAGLSVRGLRKIERGDIQRPYRRTVEMLVSALELETESDEAKQLFRARDSIPADGDPGPECHGVDGNDLDHDPRPIEADGCASSEVELNSLSTPASLAVDFESVEVVAIYIVRVSDENDPPSRFIRQAVEGCDCNQPYLDIPWL